MSAVPLRAPATRGVSSRIPRLQIVRSPSSPRSFVPFAFLCVTILIGALLGALMLNTAMASTAYEMYDQRAELARLSEHQQTLSQQVVASGSPATLAAAAQELGMEKAEETSYLNLSDGSILGPASTLIGDD